MDPLILGAIVAAVTIFILFSGISVANGLLVVGFQVVLWSQTLAHVLYLRQCQVHLLRLARLLGKWASRKCGSVTSLMA